jgi:hypothetical protein
MSEPPSGAGAPVDASMADTSLEPVFENDIFSPNSDSSVG